MAKKKKNLSHKRDYKAERALREKKHERSLSKRAKQAVNSNEKPYEDWTIEDVVKVIEKSCKSLKAQWNFDLIKDLPQGFVKHAFLTQTSRHHVGNMLVDFYGVDHVSVYECFAAGNTDSLSKLSEVLKDEEDTQWEVAYGDDPGNLDPDKACEVDRSRKDFEESHGYAPNSVFAFMESHPDRCTFDFNEDGERTVTVPVGRGTSTYTCTISSARDQFLVDFDATAPEREEADAAAELEQDACWHTSGIEIDVRDAVKILVEERDRFQKAYGFPSNSVRAYQDRYPERVERFTLNNTRKLKVFLKNSSFVCREADADITIVRGFDAVHGKVRQRAENLVGTW